MAFMWSISSIFIVHEDIYYEGVVMPVVTNVWCQIKPDQYF